MAYNRPLGPAVHGDLEVVWVLGRMAGEDFRTANITILMKKWSRSWKGVWDQGFCCLVSLLGFW